MQKRHTDRQIYFDELAITSEKFIIPYIKSYKHIDNRSRILELGCGDGGNLLPFAKIGCEVVGFDISESRINVARRNFETKSLNANFVVEDIFNLPIENMGHFDIIICHDVIEHINQKGLLLEIISRLMKKDGIAFIAFPSWQMPFGGHQQISHSRFASHCPWLHLLSNRLYRWILKRANESDQCIKELLSIKETRISIETLQRLIAQTETLTITHKTHYLINPHYNTKFGLPPLKLPLLLNIPYFRNLFTTTSFYLITHKQSSASESPL